MSKNLAQRLLVAAVGIPLLILISVYNGLYLLVFSIVLAGLAGFELALMLKKRGYYLNRFLSVVLPVICVLSAFYNYPVIHVMLLSFFLVSLLVVKHYLGGGSADLSGFLGDLMAGLIPVIYIGLLSIYIIYLGKTPDYGGLLLVFTFLVVWAADTGAYFGGKAFGKKKLAERISPNKTVAGFYGGILGALFAGVVSKLIFLNLGWLDIILMAVAACIMGQVGDLVESGIKRHCQVKDSSSALPGHGGILDRFDSFFFAVPVVYFIAVVWK